MPRGAAGGGYDRGGEQAQGCRFPMPACSMSTIFPMAVLEPTAAIANAVEQTVAHENSSFL